MAPSKERTTVSANIATMARSIDFVSRFQSNWDSLRSVLGITRMVEKLPNTAIVAKKATVELQNGLVGEGENIPYSQASVVEVPLGNIVLQKYKKGVTIEAINAHGYADAVERTDRAMINTLQAGILNKFYTFLQTGTLTGIETSLQRALSMAKGHVLDKFGSMNISATEVIGFANNLDVYDALGNGSVSIQTKFGLEYIKDYLGYSTIVLVDSSKLPRGTVIATPAENVVCYYVRPSNGEFARAGLQFATVGETPFIGSWILGNYDTDVSENNVLIGLDLFAEYLDGIAVFKIEASGSMGSATITSAAGTTAGTKITISAPSTLKGDWSYYLAAGSSAPTAPSYKGSVPANWTKITPNESGVADNVTGFTTGHKAVLVIANGAGQAIYASAAAGVSIVNA